MYAVGIITAPRRGTAYIGQSLNSYFEEWNISPHVFAEPGTPPYVNRTKVTQHDRASTLGCVMNWFRAATEMLRLSDEPFIMMCEDDIAWVPGSKGKLDDLLRVLTGENYNRVLQEALPLEKIGFISPWCSYANRPKENGWRPPRMKGPGWCGSLATVFPRASLAKLVSDEERFLHYTQSQHRIPGYIHLDYAIGQIIHKVEQMIILTHAPSLIQHIGEISTFEKNNNLNVPDAFLKSRQSFDGTL